MIFPADPTKENLTFKGWYTQRPLTYKGEPLKEPGKVYYWDEGDGFSDYNRDWKLYNDPSVDPLYDEVFLLRAEWMANVTFDSNGGNPVDDVMVKEGEKVAEPTAPTKKYAEFVNWQTENQEDYNFDMPVTGHMVLTAKWNEYPLPETKDITITAGDNFDFKDGIVNKDKFPEGTIIALQEEVDASTVGKKEVKVLVTYPNGDEKQVTYQLTVNPKMGIINQAPTLVVKDVTIIRGEKLNLMDLVVTDQDKEDGDLTKEVKLIDDGGYNKDKLGKYTITFKVTDKDGASTTKKAIVTVVEKEKPVPTPDNSKPKASNTKTSRTLQNRALRNTGDSTNILLFVALLGLSGALLIIIGYKRRKNNKQS